MRKLFFLSLIALCAPVWAAAPKAPLVQGHRGSRGTMPEDTLPAFKAALEAGVDVLEMDMAVTKDDVVVISHEPNITPERCLGPGGAKLEKPLPIRSLTLEEVKKYDCGAQANPKFPKQTAVPGTPIPTLEEVFALVRASKLPAAAKVEFNIETKIFPYDPDLSPSPSKFAMLAVTEVKRNGMGPRTIIQSFDVRTLKEVKAIAPEIRTAQLTYEELLDIVPALKAAATDIWSPNYKWITAEAVKEAQAAGIQVIPWTLNLPREWDLAIAAGVDAIITDYPADLIAHLKAKKLR